MNKSENTKIDLISALALQNNPNITKEQVLMLLEEENIGLSEKSVAELIAHMVSTYKSEVFPMKEELEENNTSKDKKTETNKNKNDCKYREIVLAIKEYKASMNWLEIFNYLDTPSLKIESIGSFYLLIDLWSLLNGKNTFPYSLFFVKWSNKKAQIDFISFLIESDPQKANIFENVFLTKIASSEDVKKCKVVYDECKEDKTDSTLHPFSSIKKSYLKTHESNFNCVELFRCIANLNSRILIEKSRLLAPDWCLLGLSFINPIFDDIFESLIFDLFVSEKYSGLVKIIYKQHPALFVEKLAKSYERYVNLSKILDIVLEAKALPYILEKISPPYFSYEVILLCTRRDHLNVYFWIKNTYQTKKDAFIVSFIAYIKSKFSNIDKQEQKSNAVNSNPLEALQKHIFPLNIDLTLSLIKNFESLSSCFMKDTVNKLNALKQELPNEIKIIPASKLYVERKVFDIITSIYSSKNNALDYIQKMQAYTKGDTKEKDIAANVILHFINNFDNFCKLESYENVAIFYAKLIENKIIPTFYADKAIANVRNAIKCQKNGFKYSFAAFCLENMIEYIKKEKKSILYEIENNENTDTYKKNDKQYVSEDTVNEMSYKELTDEVFVTENENSTKHNENKIAEIFSSLLKNIPTTLEFDQDFYNDILHFFFENKLYDTKNYKTYVNFFDSLGNDFYEFFICKTVFLLKNMVNYNLEKFLEINLATSLGMFFGEMTIAKNRLYTIEFFNTHDFVVEAIQKKKFAVCVYFIVNFLKLGKQSYVFKPYNPWFMNLLTLISELHSVNANIHNEIMHFYNFYNLKFEAKKNILENSFNRVYYFTTYTIDNFDVLLKHIISLAIDFSIREVCTGFLERTCDVAIDSGIKLYTKIYIEKTNEKKYLYNFLQNLVKPLAYISAQESIKSSIVANVSYFIKASNLELNAEDVYKIANDNVHKCCKIVERAALTKIDCVFDQIYNEYIAQKNDKTSNYSTKSKSGEQNIRIKYYNDYDANFYIPLLTEKPYFDKIDIKPVLVSEMNEIRTTLTNISKRIPNKKVNIINKEWNNILKTLNSDRVHSEFDRVMEIIEENEAKDDLCENLCQCIVGYILKHGTKKDILLKMLSKIFLTSYKTAKEVLSWITYSEDERKLNIDLVTGFVEYNLINLAEYDQHFSKCIKKEEKYFKFIICIINRLVLSDIKTCTPYDFVYTIEALSRLNEEKFDERIYDLLKKVSDMMMPVEYFYDNDGTKLGSIDGITIFEDKVHKRYYSYIDFYRGRTNNIETDTVNTYINNKNVVFKNKEIKRTENTNIPAIKVSTNSNPVFTYPLSRNELILITLGGFHLTWDTFIRNCKMPSSYSFLKIKVLIDFIATVEDFYFVLKVMTPYFLDSIQKSNYLYQKLFTFFLIELVKKMENTFVKKKMGMFETFYTKDNEKCFQNCFLAYMKLFTPQKIPIFFFSFLEIIYSDYVINIINDDAWMTILREIIIVLNKYPKLYFCVTQFFVKLKDKQTVFFAKNSFYFSLFLDNKYVYLKNIFNDAKEIDVEQKNVPMEFNTYTKTYLSIVNYCKGEISEKITVKINGLEEKKKKWVFYSLIDCLGKETNISRNAHNILKMCIDDIGYLKKLCNARNVGNAPHMLTMTIEELKVKK
ncbi:CCR4-NOT core subunit cdc39 [Binucleata daphniae]